MFLPYFPFFKPIAKQPLLYSNKPIQYSHQERKVQYVLLTTRSLINFISVKFLQIF